MQNSRALGMFESIPSSDQRRRSKGERPLPHDEVLSTGQKQSKPPCCPWDRDPRRKSSKASTLGARHALTSPLRANQRARSHYLAGEELEHDSDEASNHPQPQVKRKLDQRGLQVVRRRPKGQLVVEHWSAQRGKENKTLSDRAPDVRHLVSRQQTRPKQDRIRAT